MAHMASQLPSNVQLWRRKSSWNTSELMLLILQEVANVMQQHFPNAQPILIMDSAPIHLARAAIRRPSELGMWVLVVPARCAYALQPLDVCTFSRYKAYLRRAYQRAKNANGIVTDIAWAKTLVDVVRDVLTATNWQDAFLQTGILGVRASGRLTRDLRGASEAALAPASRRPSVHTLRWLWPTNRFLPYAQLLGRVLGGRVRVVV